MTDAIAKLAIGILTLLMFCGVAGWLLTHNPSEATVQNILMATIGWTGLVVGYVFGSSAGSSAKDKTITTLATPPKGN